MAFYSVFNQDSAAYEYFRGDGPLWGERAPKRLMGDGRHGLPPESCLPRLPPGAIQVGAGPDARGIVATSFSGFGDAGAPPPSPSGGTFVQKNPLAAVVLALGGVLLLYRLTVKVVK